MKGLLVKWLYKFTGVCFVVWACSFAVLAAHHEFGAMAAKDNPSPTVEEMLRYSIEDEYLAQAEYKLIIQHYGEVMPFSRIIKAEQQHIARLVSVYKSRGLPVPPDKAAEHVVLPKNMHDAMATGVQAELDNIAMYKKFLASPLLAKPENADLKPVFTALMRASESHLRAFQRGLSKYE